MSVVCKVACSCAVRKGLLMSSAVKTVTTSTANVIPDTPVENSIRQKLTDYFQPNFLSITNESHMHKVPKGSELHFRVVVVSDKFSNAPLIERHRLVYKILEDEKKAIIALSITAKTPDQWENSAKEVGQSPACRGGAFL